MLKVTLQFHTMLRSPFNFMLCSKSNFNFTLCFKCHLSSTLYICNQRENFGCYHPTPQSQVYMCQPIVVHNLLSRKQKQNGHFHDKKILRKSTGNFYLVKSFIIYLSHYFFPSHFWLAFKHLFFL